MKRLKNVLAALLALCLTAGLTMPARAVTPNYNTTSDYRASEWYSALEAVELTGNHATDLLQVALSQLGYHEGNSFHHDGKNLDGNRNYTEYGYWYGMNAQPWCAMYVSWCAKQAALGSLMNRTALASCPSFGTTWLDPSATPKAGDLVFFYYEDGTGWAHVAIVLHVTEDFLYTVEGNMSNTVRLRCLPRDMQTIRCYGRWTEETTSLEALGVERISNFTFDPNGGEGEMASVCTYNDTPVRFFENQVTWDEDGKAVYSTWFHRSGYTFGGWYVRRLSDGAWLTEDGFVPEETIVAEQLQRTILTDGATFSVPASWSDDPLEQFRCSAVWLDSQGRISDVTAYLPVTDSDGWCNPYHDVREWDWYYEAVREMTRQEIMNGTGDGAFSPDQTATRGMLVTLLYKLEGMPECEESSPFTDVAEEKYYARAAAWAAENGIVSGYGDGIFGPENPVSREQLAAILYQYALYRGWDVSASAELSEFSDSGEISGYAWNALQWAVGVGLITGVDGQSLAPGGQATRGQCAVILERLETLTGDAGKPDTPA